MIWKRIWIQSHGAPGSQLLACLFTDLPNPASGNQIDSSSPPLSLPSKLPLPYPTTSPFSSALRETRHLLHELSSDPQLFLPLIREAADTRQRELGTRTRHFSQRNKAVAWPDLTSAGNIFDSLASGPKSTTIVTSQLQKFHINRSISCLLAVRTGVQPSKLSGLCIE